MPLDLPDTAAKPSKPLPHADLTTVLTQTRELFDELKGQSLFITGGTGFFGMWLLESFAHANDALSLGARVTVLTRDPAAFQAKAPHLVARDDIRLWDGDVRTFAPPPGKYYAIIHAATAASATLNARDPQGMLETIVDGTRHVLQFAGAVGARKLLFTSSGAVYGRQPPQLTHISEDYGGAPDPLESTAAYGEGKRIAEHMASVFGRATGCQVKIARCFAFVGPHLPLDGTYAIGNFIGDVLQHRTISVQSDGSPYRSYLYASDLTVWLWTILLRGEPSRAYNVGSDQALTIAELAAEVAAALGGKFRIALPPRREVPAQRYVPDVRRAQTELKLSQKVDLSDAIRRTAAWHGWAPIPAPQTFSHA